MANKNIYFINAAGGNTSAIEIIENPLNKRDYINRGKKLLIKNKGIEQTGFLNINNNHLEMSGGEFCANAARSAAAILYEINNKTTFKFTMSGFKNNIIAKVKKISKNNYDITCKFPNLKIKMQSVYVLDKEAVLVDLKGIVHVIVNANFPKNYKIQHQKIMRELKISSRDAVGVCWVVRKYNKTILNPVVWVRNLNSFFYEKSCGSASIAVAKVTNKRAITQATKQKINVYFKSNNTYINSRIKIIN